MKAMSRFLITLSMLLVVIPANAYDDGTSMFPIINKSREIVSFIEDEMNYEVVRIELDILRTSKTIVRTLSSDYNYAIVAYGDSRFKDIDVKVYAKYGGEWELVSQDTDSEPVAIASVEPSYTREYMIEITAYEFYSGYDVGHYGLVICHNK